VGLGRRDVKPADPLTPLGAILPSTPVLVAGADGRRSVLTATPSPPTAPYRSRGRGFRGVNNSKTITVDGVAYYAAPSKDEAPLRIIIADRGWVFVGHAKALGDGGYSMHDARPVRRWGTTRGLGELAQEGPKSGTKIDAACPVTVPTHSVVAVLDCNPEAWS